MGKDDGDTVCADVIVESESDDTSCQQASRDMNMDTNIISRVLYWCIAKETTEIQSNPASADANMQRRRNSNAKSGGIQIRTQNLNAAVPYPRGLDVNGPPRRLLFQFVPDLQRGPTLSPISVHVSRQI